MFGTWFTITRCTIFSLNQFPKNDFPYLEFQNLVTFHILKAHAHDRPEPASTWSLIFFCSVEKFDEKWSVNLWTKTPWLLWSTWIIILQRNHQIAVFILRMVMKFQSIEKFCTKLSKWFVLTGALILNWCIPFFLLYKR